MDLTGSPFSNAEHAPLPSHVLHLARDENAALEPRMPDYLEVLSHQGAAEIWHKHGTFRDHLLGVWRILAAWGMDRDTCRLGLFHSCYANSFVRMQLFHPDREADRERVRALIGDEAERLVHTFCVVPRDELVLGQVLKAGGELPDEGITTRDFRTEAPLLISRRDAARFVVVTMADFAEQMFGWQDRLFGNDDGRLGLRGRGSARSLWPGDNRPGLWMNLASCLGRAAATCGVEPLPPVFNGCRMDLSTDDERAARDLYWKVVCELGDEASAAEAERTLRDVCERNPFVAEPHVLLAQLALGAGRFDDAEREARAALSLLAAWGTAWDKRLAWGAWVAWTRVLLKGARERSWPDTPMGIISLGEVAG